MHKCADCKTDVVCRAFSDMLMGSLRYNANLPWAASKHLRCATACVPRTYLHGTLASVDMLACSILKQTAVCCMNSISMMPYMSTCAFNVIRPFDMMACVKMRVM